MEGPCFGSLLYTYIAVYKDDKRVSMCLQRDHHIAPYETQMRVYRAYTIYIFSGLVWDAIN